MRVIGWTPEESEALGATWERLEDVVHRLQKDEAIRIRSAGAGRIGILDRDGQWIPQDLERREWAVTHAALKAEGFAVSDTGELVAIAAEDVPAKPKGRRGTAAAEG